MVRVTSITLTYVTHENMCCWSQFVKLSTVNAIQKQGLPDLHRCTVFKNPQEPPHKLSLLFSYISF